LLKFNTFWYKFYSGNWFTSSEFWTFSLFWTNSQIAFQNPSLANLFYTVELFPVFEHNVDYPCKVLPFSILFSTQHGMVCNSHLKQNAKIFFLMLKPFLSLAELHLALVRFGICKTMVFIRHKYIMSQWIVCSEQNKNILCNFKKTKHNQCTIEILVNKLLPVFF